MITRTMLRICLLLFLSTVCLEPARIAIAEDCQECDGKGTPTSVGNAEYSPGWECECSDIIPTIYDNDEDDLIYSAGLVNLWVNSGVLACPPYKWSVSGTGWSLNKNTTNNDLEQVTLSLINTTGKTCGVHYSVYATVRVTDNCGVTDDIVFRYSGGTWTLHYTLPSVINPYAACGGANCCTPSCYGSCTSGTCKECYVIGNETWCVRVMGCVNTGGGTCKPPPSNWAWASSEHNPPCGSAGACYYGSDNLNDFFEGSGRVIRYLYSYYYTFGCP